MLIQSCYSEHSAVLFDICRQSRASYFHILQGNFKFHQYQVVGRHLPTAADANPTVYRMKVWAEDDVKAKSKFW